MATPTSPRPTQGIVPRPTLRAVTKGPLIAEEHYVGGRVKPLYELSDIMPYVSECARHTLLECTVELVHKINDWDMAKDDEEPDTTRLKNIFFCGIGNECLKEDPDYHPDNNFDWVVDEANAAVASICAFIKQHLEEIPKPLTAIIDPRRNMTRAEAWVLRCAIHPDVITRDEPVKAAWRSYLVDYLASTTSWELDDDEEEPEYSFDYSELMEILAPVCDATSTFDMNFNYDEAMEGLSLESDDEGEFEPLPDVELEPYGPRHDMEDITELNPSPPKDEECAICREGYDDQADESACRQLKVCKHSFHEDCIDAWVNASHAGAVTCPYCRAEICDARPRREKENQWGQQVLWMFSSSWAHANFA